MHAPFDGPLPDGWEGGEPVTKYYGGSFTHLYKVTRKCATCGTAISLDVSKQALQGKKKNSGLLIRNCMQCRETRKAGGRGSRGGTSRPYTDAPETLKIASTEELERLTAELETAARIKATMQEEITMAWEEIRKLEVKIESLESPAKMPWEL
jgi:hypothetical protein